MIREIRIDVNRLSQTLTCSISLVRYSAIFGSNVGWGELFSKDAVGCDRAKCENEEQDRWVERT